MKMKKTVAVISALIMAATSMEMTAYAGNVYDVNYSQSRNGTFRVILFHDLNVYKKSSKTLHIWVLRRFFVTRSVNTLGAK